MDDLEKKEEPVEFEPDSKSKLKWILTGVLGVLILVNIVLLILYFALGNSGDKKENGKETPPVSEEAEQTPGESGSFEEPSSVPESSSAESEPASSAPAESVPASQTPSSAAGNSGLEEFGVIFDPVEEEQVTAKIFVNLRTYPGVRSDDDIAATLSHGEWATRVAVGRNGWCKLEYNGQTLYAVNSYLTTDANWTQQGAVNTDIEEFGVTFHAVSDMVTAKEKTNLRSQPTTDSDVVLELTNGESVSRVGYSDTGWSRLSWNGQTLYAVTSYLEIVGE